MFFNQAMSKQCTSLLVIKQPVGDTNHSLPFVASISNSYPQAFDFLMPALQGGLSTLNPPFDVEGGQSLCLSFLPHLF